VSNTPQSSYLDMPDDLPIPQDDGAADHLQGKKLDSIMACSYRDNYDELKKHVDNLFGLSVQSSEYQKELKERVELPYEILSDLDFKLATSLNLPTFEANSMKLLKRLTLIIKDGVIIKKHYPVFPSNKDVNWVLTSFSA